MGQTDEPWALIAQLATQACCCSKGRSAWLSISEWRQLLASHPALSPSSQHLLSFQSFPQRTYHEHLTVIIHLHEVTVTAGAPGAKAAGRSAERRAAGEEGDGLRYVLGSQAWAALHVFSRGYCNTGVYQLPLYQGAPSQVGTDHQGLTGINDGNEKPCGATSKPSPCRATPSGAFTTRHALKCLQSEAAGREGAR